MDEIDSPQSVATVQASKGRLRATDVLKEKPPVLGRGFSVGRGNWGLFKPAPLRIYCTLSPRSSSQPAIKLANSHLRSGT